MFDTSQQEPKTSSYQGQCSPSSVEKNFMDDIFSMLSFPLIQFSEIIGMGSQLTKKINIIKG